MSGESVAPADEQVDVLRKWLLAKERNATLTNIDMDMDLIESRVLDSLDFLNFVHLLEEMTNRELEIDAQSANVFRTLRSIRNHILAP
jgi:acyl carrier protein